MTPLIARPGVSGGSVIDPIDPTANHDQPETKLVRTTFRRSGPFPVDPLRSVCIPRG